MHHPDAEAGGHPPFVKKRAYKLLELRSSFAGNKEPPVWPNYIGGLHQETYIWG